MGNSSSKSSRQAQPTPQPYPMPMTPIGPPPEMPAWQQPERKIVGPALNRPMIMAPPQLPNPMGGPGRGLGEFPFAPPSWAGWRR